MDEVLRYRQLWGHSREQNLSGASGRGAFFQTQPFPLSATRLRPTLSLWLLGKRARFFFPLFSTATSEKSEHKKEFLSLGGIFENA